RSWHPAVSRPRELQVPASRQRRSRAGPARTRRAANPCRETRQEGHTVKRLDHLLKRNHAWAERISREDPGFFEQLSEQQAPKYLWIGCSDSRVPANQVVDLVPGEVFVHRNIANVMVHTDLNCMSVIQFAVDVLKVEHILV